MQQGSVILTSRKFGPDVWQFRWSEKDRSGRRIYRKRVIGTVQQYPDAQAAREVTTGLVGHINGSDSTCKVTVEQICEHFEHRELRSGDSFRSFATIKTYRGYIRKWIKPRYWRKLQILFGVLGGTPPISSKPIRKTNIDEHNFFGRRELLQEGPRNETGEIQGCKEMLAYRPTKLQIGLASDIARVAKVRRP